MAKQPSSESDETGQAVDGILNRVDRLPVIDDRPADEIIGYDENGAPASAMLRASDVPARRATDSEEDPGMEDWRKEFGNNIPDVVKEFLKYRHREWELEMEAELKARQEARANEGANRGGGPRSKQG